MKLRPSCVKCGSTNIKTRYDACLDDLIRTCEMCGYRWIEPPLDKVPGAGPRTKMRRKLEER
jgi:hypothetical protein